MEPTLPGRYELAGYILYHRIPRAAPMENHKIILLGLAVLEKDQYQGLKKKTLYSSLSLGQSVLSFCLPKVINVCSSLRVRRWLACPWPVGK